MHHTLVLGAYIQALLKVGVVGSKCTALHRVQRLCVVAVLLHRDGAGQRRGQPQLIGERVRHLDEVAQVEI